jgi:hypothetical protein
MLINLGANFFELNLKRYLRRSSRVKAWGMGQEERKEGSKSRGQMFDPW